MVGDSLLVTPVLEQGASTVSAWLPPLRLLCRTASVDYHGFGWWESRGECGALRRTCFAIRPSACFLHVAPEASKPAQQQLLAAQAKLVAMRLRPAGGGLFPTCSLV